MTRSTFLPFHQPDLDNTELEEIRQVLESGWLTTGEKTRQFERAFADYVGARHAIAVNSCTAAMHLALEAIGLQPGDLVFTSPYTFAATAEVISYFDALPVFVDIQPDTLNLDPDCLERVISTLTTNNPLRLSAKSVRTSTNPNSGELGRPKAIIPVHIAGYPCDMDPIHAFARHHDLIVIEDAAHTLPTRYKGRMVGSLSDFTCFSFYATKTLTTGEGGMITTENDTFADRCRVMSMHGISKHAWKRYTSEGSWYYEIIAPGFKYNPTDIASAMGLAQLRKVERMWHRRQEIAACYTTAFAQYPELQPPTVDPSVEHAWHLYILRLNLDTLSIDRVRFVEELKNRNIGVSVHFIPLHIHPYYTETYHYQPQDFPVAYTQYQRVISLPIYSRMTDQDIQDVIQAVIAIVQQHRLP